MKNSLENARYLLRNNRVFSVLSEDELDEILLIAERKVYKKDEAVFQKDETAHNMFLVESGSFILNLPNSDYKTFEPGSLFGEIAAINDNMRSGTVRAADHSSVFTICGDRLFDKEFVKPETSLKVLRALSVKISNYLRSREQTSTIKLIQEGETEHVEFKSSLRWNTYTNKKDQAIEHACLKTLAAFMNSEGGTLLIGVKDDGEILGLKNDQFQNEDKMLLHITKLINDRISPLHSKFVDLIIEEIKGKAVLRADCEAATIPAYLTFQKEDHFYVRTGPSTVSLSIRKLYDYIKMRFK
ncbi:MAG: RNA-binding domain-containing protein [Bacteroidota bacterium]